MNGHIFIFLNSMDTGLSLSFEFMICFLNGRFYINRALNFLFLVKQGLKKGKI